MELQNSTTQTGLMDMARDLTNTNSSTWSDANLKAAINRYYRSLTNLIIEAMDGWDFNGDTATVNLVNGTQNYAYPTGLLKIKRMEITYDGTTWHKVRTIDVNDIEGPTDATSIAGDFSVSAPRADLYGDYIYLYPTPTANVTGGLKVWYGKDLTDLSANTDEPNILKDYHPGIAYGAAKEYLTKYITAEGNQQRYNICSARYKEVVESMQAFYRKRVQDEEYSLQGNFTNYDYGQE